MVMIHEKEQKKFEARANRTLLEQLERWLENSPVPINNSQLLTGMVRLFLSADEGTQLKAMFGRSDRMDPVLAESVVDDAQASEPIPPRRKGGTVSRSPRAGA